MASLARIFKSRSYDYNQLLGFNDRAIDEFTTSTAFDETTASAVATVDPATKTLTSYFLDGYTGSPWTGTASNGTSGTKTLTGAVPPTVSPTQNGRSGPNFNGTTRSLGDGAGLFADSYISSNGYYYAFSSKPAAAPAFSVGIPTTGNIFGDDNQNFGVVFTDAGYYAYQYDSTTGWTGCLAPAAINVEHFVEVWHDGTYLHLRVDNCEAKPVAIPMTWMATYLSGMVPKWGISNSTGTPLWHQGVVRAFMSAQGIFSTSERDGFAEFFKTRYALSYDITTAATATSPALGAWNDLHLGSYVSGSWAATASTGTSATNGALTTYLFAPTVGPSQNGVASVDCTGSSQVLGGQNIDTYISSSQGVIFALLAMETFSAPDSGGSYQNDSRIFGHAGNSVCLTVSRAGIRGCIADGVNWNYTAPVPVQAGKYAFVQMVWASNTLKVRVNAGKWQSVYCPGVDPAHSNDTMIIGGSFTGASDLDARYVAFGISASKSDATLQNIGGWAQTQYAVDLGFTAGNSTSAIAGTTAVTFAQTGGLTASGVLAGTNTLTIGQTGTVTGKGALAGSTPVTFAQTGAVAGKGALASSTPVTFSQTGAMTGAGALAGTATVSFSQSGVIGSPGVLAGTVAVTFGQSGTATATAQAAATVSGVVVGQTGTVTGKGALAGTSPATFAQTGTLVAGGALAGSTAVTVGQTGTMAAAGVLAGSAAVALGQSGTVTGAVQAAATVVGIAVGQTGALTAKGTLAGTVGLTMAQTGAVTGSGALVGTNGLTTSQTGAMVASGVLAGSTAIALSSQAAVTQPGMNANAPVTFGASGSLVASGALAGNVTGIATAQTAALTAKGVLAGTSTVVIAGTAASGSTGALAGTTTIAFSATGSSGSPGILAGTTSLNVGQSASLTGNAGLAASSSLTFGQTASISATAAVSASAAFTFGSSALLKATAILAASTSMTLGASATLGAALAAAGTATMQLATSATGVGLSPGALYGTLQFSVLAAAAIRGIASVSGSSQLSIGGSLLSPRYSGMTPVVATGSLIRKDSAVGTLLAIHRGTSSLVRKNSTAGTLTTVDKDGSLVPRVIEGNIE